MILEGQQQHDCEPTLTDAEVVDFCRSPAPSPPPSSQAQHVATCAATSAWGAVAIDEHLARQRGARAMRDARDARCKLADGSGYTGRAT